MKTLYITDLDGTLLRDDQTVSPFTADTVNSLISRGILFTYATSRSEVSSSQVAPNICLSLPMVAYNGAALIKQGSGEIFYKVSFSKTDAESILTALTSAGVYPIVMSFIDLKDKFSYIYDKCTAQQKAYIAEKAPDDRRLRPVKTPEELIKGDVFYFTCLGDPETLKPLYEQLKTEYRCIYEVNRYTGAQWFEIIPPGVSKAEAIKILKNMLGANKTVCFGDGINDIEMFAAADEGYAVKNALPELKAIATGVIGSNNEDGVAEFIWRSGKC